MVTLLNFFSVDSEYQHAFTHETKDNALNWRSSVTLIIPILFYSEVIQIATTKEFQQIVKSDS